MKKIFIFTILILLLLPASITYAGDINDSEQTIIDRLSTAIEYHGKTYYASAEYIAQVKSYLSQDEVDFSSQEVSLYMEQFNGNIYSYVRDGYLTENVPVADDDSKETQTATDKPSDMPKDKKADDTDKKDAATAKDAETPDDKTSDSDKTGTDISPADQGGNTTQSTDATPATASDNSTLFSIYDINKVDSPFMNYVNSVWFIVIIFLFFLFALSYIVINKKIIFHKLGFLKVILIFVCLSALLTCTLTTLFFANDTYFEKEMTESGYYEYIYSQTANYVKTQSKVFLIEDDVAGLTDYIISKRFSRSQIRSDMDSYITYGDKKFNSDTVNESLKNLVDNFNKDMDLFSVSITSDNLEKWIYNVSMYYSDRISFDYARNTYLLRKDIRTYCTLAIVITGLILFIEILNLLINRKKHMLRRLQYVISAALLTVPVLLIFILYAANGSIFTLSNGTYSDSDNLYMQAAYESRIVTNFQNACVNSSFYFLLAFLIIICAIHFLVRYYSIKKYGTQ